MPHISIQAEKIGSLFGLPVTNSLLATWIVMAILIVLGIFLSRNLSLVPGNKQSILEMIVDGLYGLFNSITGENTKRFFPLLATLFIFILTANWMGLFPGVGSILIKENAEKVTIEENTGSTDLLTDETANNPEETQTSHQSEEKMIPLFRGATADLNTTLALAIIAVVCIQYYGITTVGAKFYLSKFINFKDPISFFVGFLEIIGEFTRIISFAFRLFGNIFAGEVLLTIVAFLLPKILFFGTLPFIGMEIFVGLIQALVFAMLTAVFLNVATSKEH